MNKVRFHSYAEEPRKDRALGLTDMGNVYEGPAGNLYMVVNAEVGYYQLACLANGGCYAPSDRGSIVDGILPHNFRRVHGVVTIEIS